MRRAVRVSSAAHILTGGTMCWVALISGILVGVACWFVFGWLDGWIDSQAT